MAKFARQSPIMSRFSTLAGPLRKLSVRKGYEVGFENILKLDNPFYGFWTVIVAYGALIIVLGFAYILFQPDHWIVNQRADMRGRTENWFMLFCLALLQIFLIIGTYSATRSTLKAKNPIPVRPPQGLKVAFATTRAPGEPVDMVRTTLIAAKNVRYKNGRVDVWLLDETGSPELIDLCQELGVKYFSRSGIVSWNTKKPAGILRKLIRSIFYRVMHFGRGPAKKKRTSNSPFFAARSKHGNFNSWLSYLNKRGIRYDILAGVDTDQVPEPNFLERLLGYFRDQNVAYVVGPQVYGNYKPGINGLVARWAESQASFFQSTIQRAGNSTTSPMFVGTNYAVRMSALRQIGGFQPCITEDMATGLAIHAQRNPVTGKRWKSVYTPDVLAIGEGPDVWGPYFTQQWRWAAGTFDTWRKKVWRIFYKLSPREIMHYFLMLTFYPITALTWLLGVMSSVTYLITGATAIVAPWNQFVSLYLMSVVMQLSLYIWNRRFNVSPHEPAGSYGFSGMLLTSVAAPIYLSALIGVAIGKKAHFVVTTKGGAKSRDGIRAFRIHLQWGALIFAALVFGLSQGNNHPAMLIWVGCQLVICLLPFTLGYLVYIPQRVRNIWHDKKSAQLISNHGEVQNA